MFILILYLSGAGEAWEVFKTPFRRRGSIYTHFSGAGEVLIYTCLAPERPEKPEKYLYTPYYCACFKSLLPGKPTLLFDQPSWKVLCRIKTLKVKTLQNKNLKPFFKKPRFLAVLVYTCDKLMVSGSQNGNTLIEWKIIWLFGICCTFGTICHFLIHSFVPNIYIAPPPDALSPATAKDKFLRSLQKEDKLLRGSKRNIRGS